ncbi:DUF1499 domain-containing protein [Rhodoferax sp.]|uniref:DUF1499 domain-containing protein n=1 Tax=Rhodoferax sp. TaxID=50421 RepID=UPI00272FC79F|nr:DUF1499 domain-containing protein [Rhodoferax sp.]MDP1531195.1 DUF1499 domain-containing protein [Rhodoferax sp.]MDP1942245.1 DUF1499 domain-containing protein [Rhodoferax sp.]MDP2441265.1 DUF1499 domain-containing protein [Rhodoferax sp.]MDZ4207921.1 DUF1499 domain-containing protein [Rhodoferax sp.]
MKHSSIRSPITPALTLFTMFLLCGCAAQEVGAEIKLASGSHPTDLTCPRTSNCVNSLPGNGLAALRHTGDPVQGMTLLRATLASFPEANIVRSDPLWLEVIFTTTLGFRDQVDFVLDAKTGEINYRSKSLVGRYDFGKNKSRMSVFSERFAAQSKLLPSQ